MEFKAGDKVRVKVFSKRPMYWNWDGRMDHLMGQVVEIDKVLRENIIIYDEVEKRAWIIRLKDVEPIKPECIVIFRQGNQVTALDKATGEKGVARCCPEDTFDFKTGAKLAFERLMQCPNKPDEIKYYSGKIIFTKGDRYFKTGHIYEVVNGQIKHPDGEIFLPMGDGRLKDIEDVKDYFAKASNRKRKHGWTSSGLELIEVEDD